MSIGNWFRRRLNIPLKVTEEMRDVTTAMGIYTSPENMIMQHVLDNVDTRVGWVTVLRCEESIILVGNLDITANRPPEFVIGHAFIDRHYKDGRRQVTAYSSSNDVPYKAVFQEGTIKVTELSGYYLYSDILRDYLEMPKLQEEATVHQSSSGRDTSPTGPMASSGS